MARRASLSSFHVRDKVRLMVATLESDISGARWRQVSMEMVSARATKCRCYMRAFNAFASYAFFKERRRLWQARARRSRYGNRMQQRRECAMRQQREAVYTRWRCYSRR